MESRPKAGPAGAARSPSAARPEASGRASVEWLGWLASALLLVSVVLPTKSALYWSLFLGGSVGFVLYGVRRAVWPTVVFNALCVVLGVITYLAARR